MIVETAHWTFRLPAAFGHRDITPEALALVVVINFDNRERRREVAAGVIGT